MSGDPAAVDAGPDRRSAWLTEDIVLEFAAVITLVLVVIHTEGTLRLVLLPFVAVGALSSRARSHGLLWASIGTVRAVGQIPFAWYAIDNHQYLLTYWCFALAVSFALPQALVVLRTNARLLVGLTFAFATLWKLISPDFLDGSLFHFILVAEERVATLSGPILGITPATDQDLAAIMSVALGYAPPKVVPVPYGGDVGVAPHVLAIVTVLLEGAVAAAFLARLRGLAWLRDATLLFFLWTTYLITPVIGFGMVLAAMGYVQTSGPHRRRTYLVTFAALPLFVAVTAVPRFPAGFWLALLGAVILVAYLLRAHRALLATGSTALGAGLGAVLGGGVLGPETLVGTGAGAVVVSLLDLVGGRTVDVRWAAAGVTIAIIGGALLVAV